MHKHPNHLRLAKVTPSPLTQGLVCREAPANCWFPAVKQANPTAKRLPCWPSAKGRTAKAEWERGEVDCAWLSRPLVSFDLRRRPNGKAIGRLPNAVKARDDRQCALCRRGDPQAITPSSPFLAANASQQRAYLVTTWKTPSNSGCKSGKFPFRSRSGEICDIADYSKSPATAGLARSRHGIPGRCRPRRPGRSSSSARRSASC